MTKVGLTDYYFNLPPIIQLTIHQQGALKSPAAIALTGGPGTGKSVVSLYRHMTKSTSGIKCQLLTYTTTLAIYLKACCKKQNEQASNNIESTYRWSLNPQNRDEIIVDEAQDVSIENYIRLKNFSKVFSYGADENQSLYPDHCCSLQQLKNQFPNNTPFPLNQNYRNTKSILRLAFNSFPHANISHSFINSCIKEGNKPILIIAKESRNSTQNDKQDNIILEIIKKFHEVGHNIAVLCPWGSNVQYFYNKIIKTYPNATYYYSGNGNEYGKLELSNIHVTTFKSAKGLEFDTVIIPNFHKAFEEIPSKYHVDWRDFYVGVSRAKTNLYLISFNNLTKINNCVEIESA